LEVLTVVEILTREKCFSKFQKKFSFFKRYPAVPFSPRNLDESISSKGISGHKSSVKTTKVADLVLDTVSWISSKKKQEVRLDESDGGTLSL